MVIASWPLLCCNKVIIVTTDSVILSILWKHEVQVRKIISILRLTRKNTMLIKKCSKILINDARLKQCNSWNSFLSRQYYWRRLSFSDCSNCFSWQFLSTVSLKRDCRYEFDLFDFSTISWRFQEIMKTQNQRWNTHLGCHCSITTNEE